MTFIYRLFDNFYAKYFPDFGVLLLIVTLYYVFGKGEDMIRCDKAVLSRQKDLPSPAEPRPMAAAVGSSC